MQPSTTTDPPPAQPALPLTQAAAIGGFGGIIGAILGGGTGVVTVPILDRRTTLRRAVIHGTANIANTAVAIVGTALLFVRGGHVDAATGSGLMIGGIGGAVIGARFAACASDHLLRVAFALVLTLAGIELLLSAAGYGPSDKSPVFPAAITGNYLATIGIGVVLGVVVGAWSAAMGLGGGSLTVPILVLLYGLNPNTAEGTSLLVMLPNSVVASIQHVRQGTASPRLGGQLALGAAFGAIVGVAIALALPATALSIVFGAFLIFIAAREAHKLRASRHTD